MFAVFAHAVSRENPMQCLSVGEIDEPVTPADWVTVHVRAASLNHHDLWSLKGQALSAERDGRHLWGDIWCESAG